MRGVPSSLVILALLVPLLGGCTKSADALSGVPVFDREWAEYRVEGHTGQHIGQATVEFAVIDETLRVTSSFSLVSGSTLGITGVADLQSGERLFYDRVDSREFLFGSSMVFPSDPIWALAGADTPLLFQNPRMDGLIFMVGPQWAALRPDVGVGHGVQVQVLADPEGTRIVAKAPCEVNCPMNIPGLVLVHDWLLDGGLLPRHAAYHVDGEEGGVRFIREGHETGQRVLVDVKPPSTGRPAPEQGVCNRLPCEPEDWPERVSLQRTVSEAEATLDWTLWNEQNPDAVLNIVTAASGGFNGATLGPLGTVHLIDNEFGTAYYVVEADGRYGFVVVEEEFRGVELPRRPVSTQTFTPWNFVQAMPSQPEHAVPLDELVDPVLAFQELGRDDLRSLLIWHLPSAAHPHPALHSLLAIDLGETDDGAQKYVHVSAYDGTVLRMSRNLENLLTDPNRP